MTSGETYPTERLRHKEVYSLTHKFLMQPFSVLLTSLRELHINNLIYIKQCFCKLTLNYIRSSSLSFHNINIMSNLIENCLHRGICQLKFYDSLN